MNKKELSDAVIGTLKESGKFLKIFAKNLGIYSTTIHTLPSLGRHISNSVDLKDKYTDEENYASIAGFMLGVGISAASGLVYAEAATEYNHPEYLLIPAATNLCSLLYEGYQSYKEKKKKGEKND